MGPWVYLISDEITNVDALVNAFNTTACADLSLSVHVLQDHRGCLPLFTTPWGALVSRSTCSELYWFYVGIVCLVNGSRNSTPRVSSQLTPLAGDMIPGSLPLGYLSTFDVFRATTFELKVINTLLKEFKGTSLPFWMTQNIEWPKLSCGSTLLFDSKELFCLSEFSTQVVVLLLSNRICCTKINTHIAMLLIHSSQPNGMGFYDHK